MFSFQFSAIGTHWQIDIFQELDSSLELALKNNVLERIEKFDKTYSRFRKDSWVVRYSIGPSQTSLPDDAYQLLEFYKKLYQLSHGQVTPLMGRTLEDAGYDSTYSLKPKDKITRPPSLFEALSWNERDIEFKIPVLLDLGAAGKGYLVDIICKLIESNGYSSYCVDAGGDIFYKGQEVIRVGLEHPDDSTKAICIAFISNQSICGSSGNRRRWDRFHHTIDPFTLSSPEKIKAAWVISNSAMVADGLTTLLTLDPEQKAIKDFNFDYILMYKDNTVEKSATFKGELFT